jgi:hypothetical protein
VLCPVSMSTTVHDVPTGVCKADCPRCDLPLLVIVPIFASRLWLPELGVVCSNAPCEHALDRGQVVHGVCEALRPTTARD